MAAPEPTVAPGAGEPRLYGWLTPPVVGIAFMTLLAGFGQFGAAAALGDVAEHLGEQRPGDSITEQAGLSGTALGVGLAIIRLASLFSLPLAGMADRWGRRTTLLWFCAAGLIMTATAALSPTYWWFVAVFTLGRPFLTAVNTIGPVMAAEQTNVANRAKAISLVAAGYGVGAGLVAVIRGIGSEVLGFRGVFALAVVALAAVPVVARRIREPDRFRMLSAEAERPLPVLGAVGRRFRGRLVVLLGLAFAVSVVTGPANSFVFLYAENVLGLSAAVTALMVVGAGGTGLAGLMTGRWCADTFGRRPTAAAGLCLVALAGVVTYSGSVPAVVGGYLGAVAAGSVFAPSGGSLAVELFPTEVRGAVAGWMVGAGVLGATAGLAVFGAIADAEGTFAGAAVLVFVPAAAAAGLITLLPETRGRELEEMHGERK